MSLFVLRVELVICGLRACVAGAEYFFPAASGDHIARTVVKRRRLAAM